MRTYCMNAAAAAILGIVCLSMSSVLGGDQAPTAAPAAAPAAAEASSHYTSILDVIKRTPELTRLAQAISVSKCAKSFGQASSSLHLRKVEA